VWSEVVPVANVLFKVGIYKIGFVVSDVIIGQCLVATGGLGSG
jgi:hypothetical protein